MDQEHAERESARPCEACQSKGCERCAGTGWVIADADVRAGAERSRAPSALANAWPWVGELAMAMFGIERDGLDGWLVLQRGMGETRELDLDFGRRLASLCGELDRLEREDDLAEALSDSRRR